MTAAGYAGDITSREAWDLLVADADAVLVDVRSDAEWSFVGLPNLEQLGRSPVCVSWQTYPDMALNSGFTEELSAHGVSPDKSVLLLCRSGQRSRSAAQLLTAHGYEKCFNIADGFEGPPDDTYHRGTITGWKALGLPWVQG
ncbi:MAG: rhodanese-like domain-containing protein [Alphaproteobacteria bacterium]|nr:rhodanese-like domain-containing protein [Alphaproteobacteria bacterium]